MNRIFYKSIISLIFLGILIYNLNYGDFFKIINRVDLYNFIFVFFLLFIQFPITCKKWSISLEIHKIKYRYIYLLLVCFISFFYNNFFPTNIGGDGYRIIKTISGNNKKSSAISAVIYERIVGLSALLFIGSASSWYLFLYDFIDFRISLTMTFICLFLVIFFVFLLFFNIKFLKIKKIEYLSNNLKLIKLSGRRSFYLFFYSFLFQFIAVLALFFIFKSFETYVPFLKCAVVVAISSVSALIPISLNGIGVMEGAIVVSAVHLGVGYEIATIASISLRLMLVPLSIIGGLFSFIDLEKFK